MDKLKHLKLLLLIVWLKVWMARLTVSQHLQQIELQITCVLLIRIYTVCAREWPHLKGLRFPQLGPRPIVDLLIGIDCADLHYSFKDIRGSQLPGSLH